MTSGARKSLRDNQEFRRSDKIKDKIGRGDENVRSTGSRGDLAALNRLMRIFYYTMMVKRLLLTSGFWQQRNAQVPTFISHSSANGSMWIKILSKNQYIVKGGTKTQEFECDYQALLQILERRSLRDDVFSDARSFFLKEKKKLCTIAI